MKVGLFRPSSTASQRPRTARQSIRGRISGPIPIPSPGDDDEFPIRNPGTGIAAKTADEEFPIRQRGAGIASPTPFDEEAEQSSTDAIKPPHAEAQQPQGGDGTDGSGSSRDVAQSMAPEPPANPPPAPPPAASTPSPEVPTPAPRQSPPRHRTNPSSTLRYSQISSVSTAHTGQAKDGQPQRKKSTLRGALSKLFGRKKKSASQGSNEVARDAGLATGPQHRSDPSALSRTNLGEPKRSASLPITEFDRALRSHSIGPHDMTAIETARNSLHADGSPTRRRAVTTTSRLLLQRRGELGEHLGLSPRPASTHGRGSHLTANDDDPSQIGRAITSDAFGSEIGHRRRSRSMSGLQEAADNRTSMRRRSDEIRYWRESYPGPMSPISSGNGDNDDTGAPSFALPDSPAVERTPTTPPQPFSFGNMANMNEMAGMRITQAANMETRIGTLEGRVHRIERVVEQLCHTVPGFKAPLMEVQQSDQIPRSVPAFPDQPFAYSNVAPPTIPAIYQTIVADLKGGNGSSSRYSSSRHSADDTDAHSSRMSFGEGQTYIGSLHPPSSSATQTRAQPLATQLSPSDRPTSTTTVRPAVSMPTIGGSRTPPDENSETNVVAELEAERAARQALEAQVKKLSERLNLLSTTMFAMVRDPQKSRSHERLKSAGANTPLSTTPPVPPLRSPPVGKPHSIFEDDSDLDEIKKKTSHAGSATPSDAFLTPREEMAPPQYGAFGEELRDENEGEDPQRKRAARTLSLSQLTRGKGAQI